MPPFLLAGIFMGPSQMQFPVQATAGYQAFPGMGPAMPPTTVMGAMMSQSGAAMMGPNPGMMVGMTMPNGFMGNAPAAGVMGMAPRMMGPQGGAMPAGMLPAQGMYALQPGQQAQWNMGQVWDCLITVLFKTQRSLKNFFSQCDSCCF